MIPEEKNSGLYDKFTIYYKNGSIVPENDYFVLTLNHTENTDSNHVNACRKAMLTYANEIQSSNPQLSKDIMDRYSDQSKNDNKSHIEYIIDNGYQTTLKNIYEKDVVFNVFDTPNVELALENYNKYSSNDKNSILFYIFLYLTKEYGVFNYDAVYIGYTNFIGWNGNKFEDCDLYALEQYAFSNTVNTYNQIKHLLK
jgi:hypothetical protein